MRRAVCPGSFDPVHQGHIEIITRAASLFDEVIVAVSNNPAKKYLFDLQERMSLITQSLTQVDNVIPVPFESGLIAEFVRDQDAITMVKGLRNATDLEYESPMAVFNRHLTGVETVFLVADAEFSHVSSSLIKEVAGFGGDVSAFLPAPVNAALSRKYR